MTMHHVSIFSNLLLDLDHSYTSTYVLQYTGRCMFSDRDFGVENRAGPSQEEGGGGGGGGNNGGGGGGGVPKLGGGPGAAQAPGGVQGPRPAGGSGGQSPLEAEKI